MTILNKAKAHFREIANSGTGSIEVPEWDTTIYWKIGGQNFEIGRASCRERV